MAPGQVRGQGRESSPFHPLPALDGRKPRGRRCPSAGVVIVCVRVIEADSSTSAALRDASSTVPPREHPGSVGENGREALRSGPAE